MGQRQTGVWIQLEPELLFAATPELKTRQDLFILLRMGKRQIENIRRIRVQFPADIRYPDIRFSLVLSLIGWPGTETDSQFSLVHL